MYKMYHVLGVHIDAESSIRNMDDATLLTLIGTDKDSYANLGRSAVSMIEEERMTEIELIRRALEQFELHNQIMLKPLQNMVFKHNWIKCYVGVPVGQSEFDIEQGKPILVVGVQTHDILLGLNMNRAKFTDWLVDHLQTLGLGQISKDEVKYFNLSDM